MWHHSNTKFHSPQTFVGPAANLTSPATISCSVLPPAFESGWVGIGVGEQANTGTKLKPGLETLAVWANNTWCCLGKCGAVPTLTTSTHSRHQNQHRPHQQGLKRQQQEQPSQWFDLSVTAQLNPAGQRVMAASINQQLIVHGVVPPAQPGKHLAKYANPYLAASYSTAAGNVNSSIPTAQSNAEFRHLVLNITAELPKQLPPPAPPAPPSPSSSGLGLGKCNLANPPPNQLWIFSGEDGGSAGTLRPSSNLSKCLDVTVRSASPSNPGKPTKLRTCVAGSVSQQWRYDSAGGHIASVEKMVPLHGNKANNVSRCLDTLQGHVGIIDLWDCKDGSNQIWTFLQNDGSSPLQSKKQGTCLVFAP